MNQWFSWLEHGRPFARWHTVSMYVDPSDLAALTSCRLIALDKCSRVRPIEIGETARHILGKAILAVMGVTLLCAGPKAGFEVAIHAMRQIFEDANTQAALLVDAWNAFNNLYRQTALLNTSI